MFTARHVDNATEQSQSHPGDHALQQPMASSMARDVRQNTDQRYGVQSPQQYQHRPSFSWSGTSQRPGLDDLIRQNNEVHTQEENVSQNELPPQTSRQRRQPVSAQNTKPASQNNGPLPQAATAHRPTVPDLEDEVPWDKEALNDEIKHEILHGGLDPGIRKVETVEEAKRINAQLLKIAREQPDRIFACDTEVGPLTQLTSLPESATVGCCSETLTRMLKDAAHRFIEVIDG